MRTPFFILGLSVASFLFAACLLGAFISGPLCFLAGPIIALFGWFYFPIVLLLHVSAWFASSRANLWLRHRWVFPLAGSLFAAILFAIIGVKEQGHVLHYTVANSLAAFASAWFSCWLITCRQNDAKASKPIAE